jgi:hypothetical protein
MEEFLNMGNPKEIRLYLDDINNILDSVATNDSFTDDDSEEDMENCGVQKDSPSPEEYTKFLKETITWIKQVFSVSHQSTDASNPDCQYFLTSSLFFSSFKWHLSKDQRITK